MQTTWDLTKIYTPKNEKDFEDELKLYEESAMLFVNKWNPRLKEGIRDDYLNNPKVLKEALDEYELWSRDANGYQKISYYYSLASALDQTDPKIKARENKVHEIEIKISNEMQFFTQRLAKVNKKTQDKFLNSTILDKYHHFLKRLFEEAKYLLTEPEEKILTLKSKVSYANWVSMVSELISKSEVSFKVGKKNYNKQTFEDLIGLINDSDKKTRDSAAKYLNKILDSISDVATAEINSVLENKKIDDNLRGVERPDLIRHLSDDIETEMVDSLRKSVIANNDISQEFYKLKAQLLGQTKLEYHERNVPFGKIGKTFNYEESLKIIERVFSNLSPEFKIIFQNFLNGYVDVNAKKGKYGGAFCTYGLMSVHSHILLNYKNQLNDVLTFAHELGHGINHELMKAKNHSLDFEGSLATAEVASTFMEDFVLQELAKEADEEMHLALNMMKLNDDISTIIRQIAFYNFEFDLHTEFRKQGYLSKELIGKLFQKHTSAYMGDYVEQSKGSENWWIYVSHFRNFFYVYSYASGLLISKSMQNSYKEDPKFIQKVIKFLEAGGSKSPKDIFLDLGIDISKEEFWQNGMNEIRNLLEETKSLAKKLNLIS